MSQTITADLIAEVRKPQPRRLQLTTQAEHHDMPTFLDLVAELGFPQLPVFEQPRREGQS